MIRADGNPRPVILTTAMGCRCEALEPFVATCKRHILNAVIQRFFRYHRLLAESGHRFPRALLADIRDVVFQCDPFPRDGLHVFAENERIGQNHFARRWFQPAYGWSSWRMWQQTAAERRHTTSGDIKPDLRINDLPL